MGLREISYVMHHAAFKRVIHVHVQPAAWFITRKSEIKLTAIKYYYARNPIRVASSVVKGYRCECIYLSYNHTPGIYKFMTIITQDVY